MDLTLVPESWLVALLVWEQRWKSDYLGREADLNGGRGVGFKHQVKREEEVGRDQCLSLMLSKEETPAQVGNISAASGGI